MFGGVADGTRTHDNQNHNLGLYQLSYSHRSKDKNYSLLLSGCHEAFAAFCCSGALLSITFLPSLRNSTLYWRLSAR